MGLIVFLSHTTISTDAKILALNVYLSRTSDREKHKVKSLQIRH